MLEGPGLSLGILTAGFFLTARRSSTPDSASGVKVSVSAVKGRSSISGSRLMLSTALEFLPAGRAQSARPAGPLDYFAVSASVYMCVHTYHVRNNYVTYIVAMRPYFSRLRQFSCYE